MEKLPVGIIEAALRRMEDIEPTKIHPYHDDQEARQRRAYAIMDD